MSESAFWLNVLLFVFISHGVWLYTGWCNSVNRYSVICSDDLSFCVWYHCPETSPATIRQRTNLFENIKVHQYSLTVFLSLTVNYRAIILLPSTQWIHWLFSKNVWYTISTYFCISLKNIIVGLFIVFFYLHILLYFCFRLRFNR